MTTYNPWTAVFGQSLPSLRGVVTPLQQWFEANFDPSTGFTFRGEYRGLDFFTMNGLSNYFTQLGMKADFRWDAGIATLAITDPTQNVLIDRWELGVDEEKPSIWENPIFQALINTQGSADAAIILAKMKNAGEGNIAWADLITDAEFEAAAGGMSEPQQNQLEDYLDYYLSGITNFLRGKYRLRLTMNAPARWGANIADFNVEKIYTIAQLLSEVTSRSLWILPLPAYLNWKIQNYVAPDLTATPEYIWGALKTRSGASTAANNRVDITTEYLIDAWTTWLYPAIA